MNLIALQTQSLNPYGMRLEGRSQVMEVPRLKSIRESKGWSQQTLADKIGTHKTLVSRWETGKSSISLSHRQKLCDVLGVTLQELGSVPEEVKESREYTGSDERLLRHAAEALKNPHLIQYLKWKYHNMPILERCGQVYPVAVFPAQGEQMKDLESVLVGRLDKTINNDQDKNLGDPQFREMVKRLGRFLENRVTYTMKELLTEEYKVDMTCGIGTYFECLDTCDSLEWELLSNHHYLSRSDEKAFQQFETCSNQELNIMIRSFLSRIISIENTLRKSSTDLNRKKATGDISMMTQPFSFCSAS